LEYSINHYGDSFYIMTNADKATNFKLMKTLETATSKENWTEVVPHREDVLLEDIEIFKDFLVVEERTNGLNRIRIMPWSGKGEYYLPFESETYTAYTGTNVDFDTDILRYSYQSMTTPSSVIDFNLKAKTKEVKFWAENSTKIITPKSEFGLLLKTVQKFPFRWFTKKD
jgi:oligopeptidase B